MKFIKKIYNSFIFARCDDKGTAYYFSAKDFDSLTAEPYTFKGNKGQKLCGNFYYYENFNPDRIIVFDHGMGGGHLSYMREIEELARHGYKVFAYDHTGCMKSEGENTVGFTQSLADLDCALKTLKADEKYKGKAFAVIGHSWGGYSTLNISAFHPDLTHVIVLSGPASVEKITEQFGPLKNSIRQIEKQANPEYADCDGVKSLKNSKAKALLVYSDNDKMVNKEQHFDYLKSGLADRENTFFHLENGKDHNPNYTADAVKYLGEYLAELNKKKKELRTPEQKKAFVDSFDWWRMTAQDEKVWNKIFEVLDS